MNSSVRPRAVGQRRESGLSSGVGLGIAFQRLNSINGYRFSACSLSFVYQQNLLAAGAMPALVLTENKRDHHMPAVPVPAELTAKGT
jgi:hypothetical protein